MDTSAPRALPRVGFVATAIDLTRPAEDEAVADGRAFPGPEWFETRASTAAPEATVSVTGTPSGRCLDGVGDRAELNWVITNNSSWQTATVNALMQLHGETTSLAADGVRLEYSRVDAATCLPEGMPADGGTLSCPQAFVLGDVLNPWDGCANAIAPGESVSVRVTATFDDPATGPRMFETAVLALTYRFCD